MNYRPYLVLDTETTGLNPDDGHEITQLSALALNATNLKIHPAGKFNVFIKPQKPELASPEAIAVAEASWKKANESGVHPKVAAQKFMDWAASLNPKGTSIYKPIFSGWNVPFDLKFVNHLLTTTGVAKTEKERPYHYNSVDVMTMYFALLESHPDIRDNRMDTVMKAFGMTRKSESHDAMEDVELCAELLQRGLSFFRRCQKSMKIIAPQDARQMIAEESGV